MKKITLCICILITGISYSQLINSNKNTVSEFYDGNVKSVELNGAKVTAQFRLKTWHNNYDYVNQPEITSAVKNNSLFLNTGITNTGNFLNLNKFDFKKNNGYILGLTFQHSFSEIYLANDSINYDPHHLQSFILSLDYQRDKFDNYDPSTNEISKATPDKLILKAGWSLYKFHYRESAKLKYTWIPSFYSQINLIGYNESTLQNYLINDKIDSVDNIIYTSSTSFDGKYGVIDNNIKSAQISFSSPIVPAKSFFNLPIIAPIPYFSFEVFDKNKPRWNGGFSLGLLSTSLVDSKSILKDGGRYKTFNVPSFLTIGMDWNHQNGKGSKPNYFVSGSIKLK